MTNSTNQITRDFLDVLFRSYFESQDGYIELICIPQNIGKVELIFCPKGKISNAEWQKVLELNKTHNIYFGVNPRLSRYRKKSEDIKDVICLWVDLDGKDFFGEKEEALRRANDFPLPPSIIVDSGHGYHCYWVLETSMIGINDSQRSAVLQNLSGLVNELHGDRCPVSLSAHLRLPGTLNIKDNPPIAVKVMNLTNQKYQFKDFDRFKNTAYKERETFSGELPVFGTRTEMIIDQDENSAIEKVTKLEVSYKAKYLIITGKMQQEEDADNTRSGRDFSIICSLIKNGYDYPTIKSIFFNSFLKCSNRIFPKGERALQGDVGSALMMMVQPRNSEGTQSSPALATEERLQVRCAANIEPEETSWLWPERFSLGKLSLIVGDPESGKSLFCAWMAAKVSSGKDWPDHTSPSAGKVIILQCEDDVAETVVPRIIQYGADLLKVHFVEGVKTTDGGDRMISLFTDLKKLEELIRRERDVRLVIIDPLQAYLGAGLSNKINPHADAHIRAILTPVKVLAEEYGVAVVGVVHLNKDAQKDMMYRVGGSIALVGLPRSIWLLQWNRDPNGFRYFQSMKSNRRAGVSGLAFKIDRDTGEVSFHDDVPVPSVLELLAPTADRRPREEAKAFLRELLMGGPRESTEIHAEAEQNGINYGTLCSAKKELGIKSEKTCGVGRGGKWLWHLPARKQEGKPSSDIKARLDSIQEKSEEGEK